MALDEPNKAVSGSGASIRPGYVARSDSDPELIANGERLTRILAKRRRVRLLKQAAADQQAKTETRRAELEQQRDERRRVADEERERKEDTLLDKAERKIEGFVDDEAGDEMWTDDVESTISNECVVEEASRDRMKEECKDEDCETAKQSE